jgi:histidinol-phosphate aminotransferase
MNLPLKLDFNERSDRLSPLANDLTFGDALWRYPERQALEQQIAELNGLDASQVICTNGGDEAIMLLMRIIKETSRLVLPLPAFSQYTFGVTSWRLDAELIPPNADLSIDLQSTQTSIARGTSSVTIITRPNNPTGEMIAIADLLTILETARAKNSWVFLDEAYIEFSENFDPRASNAQTLLSQFDNLVILRTFSKAFGLAGIRVGYLLGNQSLIQLFSERCMPFNIPQPSLSIASQALHETNRAEVQTYCQTIAQNRKQLVELLSDMGVTVLPSEANFITLRLPPKQARAVKSFLAKNNILVRSFDDNLMQDCLRITLPYQIERLSDLLKQAISPALICLDMDGVLIDTTGSYLATIIATVARLTDKTVSMEIVEQMKNAGGFNNDWVLTQSLCQALGFELSLADVTDVFQSIYLGNNGDGLVKNEAAIIKRSLVEKINQSQRTSFAIFTGRPKIEAIAGSKMVGLENLAVVSLDDVVEAKPSPEGINKLQARYSKLSWMCGDNPDDMLAAVASNSLAIGIGDVNASALYSSGADIVLNSINELEEWL